MTLSPVLYNNATAAFYGSTNLNVIFFHFTDQLVDVRTKCASLQIGYNWIAFSGLLLRGVWGNYLS